MFARACALLCAFVLVGSCSTVGVTSPYAKLGSKEVYEYGTFCGPRLPVTDLPRLSDEKRAFLLATPAQDSIDMACKIHDVCYEFYGHDNFFCDSAMLKFLSFNNYASTLPRRPTSPVASGTNAQRNKSVEPAQCRNLGKEIARGMILKEHRQYSPQGFNRPRANISGVDNLPFPFTVLFITNVNRIVGFPFEAGHCKYGKRGESLAMESTKEDLIRAALVFSCGCKSKMSENKLSVDFQLQSCSESCVRKTRRDAELLIVGVLRQ
jgi:hypothetical protein